MPSFGNSVFPSITGLSLAFHADLENGHAEQKTESVVTFATCSRSAPTSPISRQAPIR